MKTFEQGDQVTFSNSQRVIFHLTVVDADVKLPTQADEDHFTKCAFESGTTAIFHTSDLSLPNSEA